MATLTAKRTMLYCPKCQRKYQEGSQRFCNNDGRRLLPSYDSESRRESETKGVFTNLLAKSSRRHRNDEQMASTPRFVKVDEEDFVFDKISNTKIFKTEQKLKPQNRKPVQASKPVQKQETPKSPPEKINVEPIEPKRSESIHPLKTSANTEVRPVQLKSETIGKEEVRSAPSKETVHTESVNSKEKNQNAKPVPRLINSSEIEIKQAELGDRKNNPSGRDAISWQNPRILIGKIIKGRYHIVDKLNQNLTSIAFLAEDKLNNDVKVCVRVLMNQSSSNDFQNKLLTEERVSLSHINHPNVAKLFDSGDLPEGKPFVVTSFAENESVKGYLKKTGVFNPMRTARIIRQASFALSEVHENGILHRNLQPQHLLLSVSETGNEIVKVTDFCVSNGKITPQNYLYKAPEQLKGQLPTFASDSYSLAIIAFEMLTNQLPFKGATERELLKAQSGGITITTSDLNPDIDQIVDDIFAKALSVNPDQRYPKARDFGEALFNALTNLSPWEQNAENDSRDDSFKSEITENKERLNSRAIPTGLPSNNAGQPSVEIDEKNVDIANEIHIDSIEDKKLDTDNSDMHFDSSDPDIDIEEVISADLNEDENFEATEETKVGRTDNIDSLWKNRSPEPAKERGLPWTMFSVLGLIALLLSVLFVWNYFGNREVDPIAKESEQKLASNNLTPQGVDSNENANSEVSGNEELPPNPRKVETPENYKYFELSKQNLSPELRKSFKKFSISFPEDWKIKKFDKNRDKVDDKFLDIANESPDGIPIESMMISPYKSEGLYSKDEKLFPALVKKSNKDISDSLSGNFEVVSESSTTIQNGRWKAYQVNFRTKESGEVDGKKIELWGRRLWIPIQRPGMKTGFIITMFATSLSEDVKSADEVGKKGELAKILQTFEPDQSF